MFQILQSRLRFYQAVVVVNQAPLQCKGIREDPRAIDLPNPDRQSAHIESKSFDFAQENEFPDCRVFS